MLIASTVMFRLMRVRFCFAFLLHESCSNGRLVSCLQALLDMYTIQRELGYLDNIRVGLVGDLANGRTVRSLAYLLAKYDGVKIYFVAPDVVKMKVLSLT